MRNGNSVACKKCIWIKNPAILSIRYGNFESCVYCMPMIIKYFSFCNMWFKSEMPCFRIYCNYLCHGYLFIEKLASADYCELRDGINDKSILVHSVDLLEPVSSDFYDAIWCCKGSVGKWTNNKVFMCEWRIIIWLILYRKKSSVCNSPVCPYLYPHICQRFISCKPFTQKELLYMTDRYRNGGHIANNILRVTTMKMIYTNCSDGMEQGYPILVVLKRISYSEDIWWG